MNPMISPIYSARGPRVRQLVVGQAGTRLVVRDQRFVILKETIPLAVVPYRTVESILLIGQVEISSGAIKVALRQGIELSFFDGTGRFLGWLHGPGVLHAELRRNQLAASNEPSSTLEIARGIVLGKIRNQRSILLRAQRRHRTAGLAQAASRIRGLAERAAKSEGLNPLRGFEGASAQAYFGAFPQLLKNPEFSFAGRNRRPPKDPINAMLSFGYALLQREVTSAVARVGLEPHIGFLHEASRGRPSLVLDLMEEWRPLLVDTLVLRLVNRRQLTLADFEPSVPLDVDRILSGEDKPQSSLGIYLAPLGRRIVITAFLEQLRQRTRPHLGTPRITFRDAIEAQVRCLARTLEDPAVPYEPFLAR
jgi:CRISP-associated protein Cas1